MSEDTDLFAYGCKRIMKCVNIYNGNFIMYRIESMLNFYNLELNDFKIFVYYPPTIIVQQTKKSLYII